VYLEAYVFLLINGVLISAVCRLHFIGSNGKMMGNNGEERLWKEVVMALIEILSQNFP
jgi:hypothetical protein